MKNIKKASFNIFAVIILVSILSSCYQEKVVYLDEKWKSYKYQRVGFTVKIPKDVTVKTQNEYYGEFFRTGNVAWFNDGVFSSISSSIIKDTQKFDYTGFEPKKRQEILEQLEKSVLETRKHGKSDLKSFKGSVYQFTFRDEILYLYRNDTEQSPFSIEGKANRLNNKNSGNGISNRRKAKIIVVGEKYIHFADFNLKHLHRENSNLKNLSFHDLSQQYYNIAKIHILNVDSF